MAKSRGYEQAWLSGARNPSTFAWIVAIFAVAVQYGAFPDISRMGPNGEDLPDLIQNPGQHSVRHRKFGFYSDRV